MPTSVTVSYGRKRTDKLGDGSFDAVELGGILTTELPDSVDPLATYKAIFESLKDKVDGEFEAIPKNPLAVLKAIPAEAPRQITTNNQVAMDAPPAKPSEPLGWLKDTVDRNTAAIQERITALPGESLSGTGSSGESVDDYGTPDVSSITPNQAVMFQGCRVFEVKIAKAVNGNEYCAIRIGKRGVDGIPGQYTTARSFEPNIVEAAKRIREGDMIDVYGYFKPWRDNAEKFDLELQKVEQSE